MTTDSSEMIRTSGGRCVFTTLIGRYERLNEQPTARDSAIPYICLTDDPKLCSETWQVRIVVPSLELDPVRSQRDLKIRPHLHLAEFERSLYIDNTVRLTVPAEAVFALVPDDARLALVPHDFRERVLDEFLVVAESGLDDQGRIFEQLNHYQIACPEILQESPWWTGLMIRDHSDADVRRMGEVWLGHVLRYSRRDQLSVNVALRQAGLVPHVLDLANHTSAYHTWPHRVDRDLGGIRHPVVSLTPPAARIRAAELALAEQATRAVTIEGALTREANRASELEGALTREANRASELEGALFAERDLSAAVLSSTSWRLTAPGRAARSLLRDALRLPCSLRARLSQDVRMRRARLGKAVTTLRRTDLHEEAFHGWFKVVHLVRRRSRGRRRLPVGPDSVTRPYMLWKVACVLGIDLVPLTDQTAPLAFHFHDTTRSTVDAPAARRTLNGACRDISKQRVEQAMLATFGYGLAVNPNTHIGPMVEKSDRNAAHDGLVIVGPVSSPDPTKIYQHVLDNEVEPGIVEDLRTAVVAGTAVVVFRKRRRIHERFADTNQSATVVAPATVFSDDERRRIIAFADDMGLDMGMLDIVRDRLDGRIHVVDVNNTPFAPPKVARTLAGIRAMHQVAAAFEREWGRLLASEKR